MKKAVLLLVFPIFLLLLPFSYVFAAEFALTHIGALDLGGNKYTEWWYTGENPTLIGTAEPSATVTVKIGDESDDIKADSSGDWSFPTSTLKGDYVITVSSGGSTYTFTLHTGQNMPSNSESASESTSSVPQTGSNQIYTLIFSLVLISAGYALFSTSSVKKEFEKTFARRSNK